MTIRDINDIIKAVCPNDEDYEKPCISPKYLRQELEQLALDQESKMLNCSEILTGSTTKNDLAQERYQDLIEYFGDEKVAKTILESRKEFKEWLERLRWNVKRADELAKELEQLKGTTKNDLAVDCISRAEMLRYQEYLHGKMSNEENYKLWKFIKALPSVTPQESRWIPVSEKLPEPFTFVNATCRSLVDDREDWVVETIYLPIPKEVNKYGYSDWGNIPMLNWGEAEVIAWVERIIPQPYKADMRENKE